MSNSEFRFESNADNVLKALLEAQVGALQKIGVVVQGQAKTLSPVGQYDDGRVGGRLRDSIDFFVDKNGNPKCVIGTNVEYALFVEKGTSRMSAQPYLTPAVEGNMGVIKAIVEDAYSKLK